MSYIDIAIIALVVLMGLVGLWKGFFKTFIGMFGGIIALLLAIFLAKPIAEVCLDGFAQNFVLGDTGSIRSFVEGLLPEAVKALPGVAEVTPEMLSDALGTGIFGFFLKPFAGLFLGSQMVAESVNVASGISVMVAYLIFSVMVGIALFILARLVMCLFTMFAKSFSRDGKPSGLSRLLGGVLGAARGALYACVLLLVASFMTGFPFMSGYNAELDKSVIAKPINEIVVKIPGKLFNDEGLFDKLLDRAGLTKPGEEGGDQGYTMSEAERRLADAFTGVIDGERLAGLYGSPEKGNDTYNEYIQVLEAYNDAAAEKIAAGGKFEGEEGQQRCAALAELFVMKENPEERSTLYQAYDRMLTNLAVYVSKFEELDADQRAEKAIAIEDGLAVIKAEYENYGITALFGDLLYPEIA